MNRRLFFLQQEGWFEVEIAGKLLQATETELIRWAYGMMERHHYRNYLITENPETSLRGGSSMQPFSNVDFATKQSARIGNALPIVCNTKAICFNETDCFVSNYVVQKQKHAIRFLVMTFMYLNCHSYYSLRYGTLPIEKLVIAALKNDVKAMALTDINNSTA